MSRRLVAAAIAAGMSIVVSVPASAGDYTQLARVAGVSAAELGTMSLDQIAALKFSGEGHDNVQAFVARTSLGGTTVRSSRAVPEASLDAYHLRLINVSVSGDQRQPEARNGTVSADIRARGQLAASTGLSDGDASRMSLAAIAARKFARDPRE